MKKAERDALRAEVEHLRRGIEAYREFRQRWQNDEMNVSDQGWWDCLEAVGQWEHEEAKRDER